MIGYMVECSNDPSPVVPLDLVERLTHGIEVGVCVDAQSDVEIEGTLGVSELTQANNGRQNAPQAQTEAIIARPRLMLLDVIG